MKYKCRFCKETFPEFCDICKKDPENNYIRIASNREEALKSIAYHESSKKG